ncbi:uncharacterized protein F5Z01DRAFT_726515 [Emericellopsis atlantica]|uniref:AAA+ ATPase domain-containing protein n=1 Tax=Emericellopsis atlantica TaxID=2614577 RepID=A0A9P7ZJC3_9HYPO|nr:uncharacterized protein F5Z01DRAFT_726515 [Emericellopsis atlantica]KAG9252680.1 hypothetical protein F5Z01DRAFT_726515 [Emericellopsis atlantica]
MGTLETFASGGFRPLLPRWFLDNVRTPDELQDLKPLLKLVDDALDKMPHAKSYQEDDTGEKHTIPSEEDSTSDDFSIDRLEMEDVLDMTAALHMTDLTLMPAASPCAIILLSKMRLGYDFLDRVVVTMAREMGSSLITFTSSELQDIAWDFLRQRTLYLKEHSEDTHEAGRGGAADDDIEPIEDAVEYFFGNRSRPNAESSDTERNAQAISVLLGAATAKTEAREATDGGSKPDRVSSTTSDIDGSSIVLYMRHTLFSMPCLQRRILCRIRDALVQRRRAGQRVTLVIGFAHTEANEETTATSDHAEHPWLKPNCSCHLCVYEKGKCCDEYICSLRTMRRKLTDANKTFFVLEPKSVPKEWPGNRLDNWPPSLVMANIQSFKRYLRENLPGVSSWPADLLDPESDWTASLSSDKFKYFCQQTRGEALVVELARTYVVGRGLRQKFIRISDVETAFDRAELAARSRGFVKTRPAATKDSTDIGEGTGPTWKQKIEAVQPSCNEQEQELLSSVLDPETLGGTQDEIDIGEGIFENLSRLVSQTTGSAASALSRSARITGALLYGPPGTGKTLLARVLAKQTGTTMINLDASSVNSKWVGDTEKAIAAAFSLGRKLSPCIIFIDEVDALFFRRSDDDACWRRQALNQFLQSMDGVMQGDDAPFVLGATNRPFDLDSAFLRRMPYQVEFGLPNLDARARILRMILREEELDTDMRIDSLVMVTRGFSGSDLKNLCAQASLACWLEQNTGRPGRDVVPQTKLAHHHFSKALEMTHATVLASDEHAIAKFKDLHGTALQTAQMMRMFVEMKRGTRSDGDSSSCGDDSSESNGEYNVGSQPAMLPPQDGDQVQAVVEIATEKVDADRESDIHRQELEVNVDAGSDAEQR